MFSAQISHFFFFFPKTSFYQKTRTMAPVFWESSKQILVKRAGTWKTRLSLFWQ
jgi:hypothetical protein